MIRTALLAAALALPAAPALAQDAPAAATAAPATDPAALAVARRIAARLIPPGTYKQIMGDSMAGLMDNIADSMKALPLGQIAEMGGLSSEEAAKLDKVDIAKIMEIYDPHWEERLSLEMRGMFGAMGEFFTGFEPELREAMAMAYTHHFTTPELQDLDRYFATPTGAKYAANSMTVMMDPAVIEATKAMMPKMMAEMPTFIAAAKKASEDLPPPRKLEDLTPEEKADLAKALGVDPGKLKDPKSPL